MSQKKKPGDVFKKTKTKQLIIQDRRNKNYNKNYFTQERDDQGLFFFFSDVPKQNILFM